MKRREFITRLGGAAAAPVLWPDAARAQQSPMPTIGFLHSGSAETNTKRLAGFRKGLAAAGFVEGRNVAIEFRWTDGHNDRLPGMGAELIRKPVTLIATLSTTVAALAAHAATKTIPIVFLIAEDPVKLGLAQSFNHPGGNATGITSLNSDIAAKRLGLLHDTLPKAAVAVLINPANPNAKPVLAVVEATARNLGLQLQLLNAEWLGAMRSDDRPHPQWRKGSRPADRAGGKIRDRVQSQDRESAGHRNPIEAAVHCRRSDRMRARHCK
jgi:putative ABC transport system substrate-binding protein